MDTGVFKIVAFFGILATGIFGGMLSRWLSGSARSEMIFSLGNAFAGGVFLGAGIIHMLPDAQEGFSEILGESDYPWFALVCTLGFLFILFLEKILFHHEHHGCAYEKEVKTGGSLYPYVLMLVLSIHSIITGIALGTETRIVQAMVILIAVLAHKGTASFALGVSMQRSQIAAPKALGMIVFFSFMTPLGVLLGCGFMEILTGRAEQTFECVFDALAAGSFIYIAVLDIMQEEFGVGANRWQKFGFVLLGLGVMAVVAIWT